MIMVGLLPAADAGNGNYVVVEKVVDGPVPEGTVFEIEVDCSPTNGVPPTVASDPDPVTLTFDANGDPLDADRVGATPFQTCTVTETVTGGATVGYACAVEQVMNGAAPDAAPGASCLDDQTVVFEDVVGAEGTVMVTNTFEPELEAQPDSAARAPGVVAARPAFTG
jgi:hypothetical protein